MAFASPKQTSHFHHGYLFSPILYPSSLLKDTKTTDFSDTHSLTHSHLNRHHTATVQKVEDQLGIVIGVAIAQPGTDGSVFGSSGKTWFGKLVVGTIKYDLTHGPRTSIRRKSYKSIPLLLKNLKLPSSSFHLRVFKQHECLRSPSTNCNLFKS